MIRDMLLMESVFDRAEAALYLDEVLCGVDVQEVKDAIEAGYITTKAICIGPDCGRVLCSLSEKGRCKAMEFMH